MKYRILWFDDNEDYIETHQDTLKAFVEEQGFELVVIPKEDDEDLENVLKESQPDLILMDYHLSNTEENAVKTTDGPPVIKGDSVITRIRNFNLFVEAVLYSRDETFQADITERLEGVYYAGYKELPEKAKKIICLTIKKQQDIANTRGLIISDAIDVASQMEELIIAILNVKEPVNMKLFDQGIMHSEFFGDQAKYEFILSLLKKKQKILNEIANGPYEKADKEKAKETLKLLNSKLQTLVFMKEEVIEQRNQLAHAKPTADNLGYTYKYENITLGDEECRQIRKNFRKHKNNLKEITDNIDLFLKIDYPPKK